MHRAYAEEAPYKYVSKMRASIVVWSNPVAESVTPKFLDARWMYVIGVVLIFTQRLKHELKFKQLVISKLRQNACMEPISIWIFLVLGQLKNLMMAATLLADGVTVLLKMLRVSLEIVTWPFL